MEAKYLIQLGWLPPAPVDWRQLVEAALTDRSAGGDVLRRLAMSALSEAQLTHLGRAIAKARQAGRSWTALTRFRLAILCNGTALHLVAPLTGSAVRYGIDLDVMALSYEEAAIAAMSGDGRLRDFAPDAVLVAIDHHGIPSVETCCGASEERQAIDACIAHLQAIYAGVQRDNRVTLIKQTIVCPPSVFGHAARRTTGSLARILDEVNRQMGSSPAEHALFDLAALAERVGTAQWFDTRLWHLGKIPFAMHYVPLYADHVCRVIGAMRGKSRRVLVMDLDNTLWGGVVGDDGVEGLAIGNGSAAGEAFLDVQRQALAYRGRGVLLAVASKNDEAQARRPFREIPDMLLKEDSFAAFRANWRDKAASIREIASELSLGLDAFVFMDDNPAERALVRQLLPDVAVLELPPDPSDYAEALDAAGYFESVSFSEEDTRRADLYRSRQAVARVPSHDLASFLESLKMRLVIEKLHSGNRARVVQLINKSNQFNLTTKRYTDAEVAALEQSTGTEVFSFRLIDSLDDHGIISVIVCSKDAASMQITSWVMSCRVIGRCVERAAIAFLIQRARQAGCKTIRGTYIPTPRNQLVEAHYPNLGFMLEETSADGTTRWALPLEGAEAKPAPLEIIAQMEIGNPVEAAASALGSGTSAFLD